MYRNSMDKFLQIEQILEQNEQDTAQIKRQLEQDCFIRAKAAAYILQNHPEVVRDQQEMAKIANLLQVDEFHLFDTEGNLYAGSQPKYFGPVSYTHLDKLVKFVAFFHCLTSPLF